LPGAEPVPGTEGTPSTAPAPALQPAPPPPPQAAPPPPPPAAHAPQPSAEGEGKQPEQKCAIGDLCLGPVLTLGLINPFGIGAHARYGKLVGFGIDYQFMPAIHSKGTSAGWSLLTFEGRFYPFGGSFWLGGGIAFQTFSASITTDMGAGPVKLEGTLFMPAIKIGLGFMGHDGFVMGIDLDANFPLAGTKVKFKTSGAGATAGVDLSDQEKSINDAANLAVKLIPFIPQLNLLRIGYLF
jgi:hypothetical protein